MEIQKIKVNINASGNNNFQYITLDSKYVFFPISAIQGMCSGKIYRKLRDP
jgi:hypothetical protein